MTVAYSKHPPDIDGRINGMELRREELEHIRQGWAIARWATIFGPTWILQISGLLQQKTHFEGFS